MQRHHGITDYVYVYAPLPLSTFPLYHCYLFVSFSLSLFFPELLLLLLSLLGHGSEFAANPPFSAHSEETLRDAPAGEI